MDFSFGSPSEPDVFPLSDPMILTLDSDQASVFTVGVQSFGRQPAPNSLKIEGFAYSVPNSTVQAVSCSDSLWDAELEIASKRFDRWRYGDAELVES
jgi:hypothetical protein